MLYRNDNIIIKDEEIKGTLEDLREYFRYQIAGLCLTGENEREGFTQEVREIADLLDNLEEDLQLYDKNDFLIVRRHPMGGYTIEGGAE